MLTFTILGASGFLGRALTDALQAEGHTVHPVTRSALPALLESRRNAGHVIDCIGLTADFRVRPYDTAEAHVGITARALAGLRCNSFLFLSSTRVYARADVTHEDAALPLQPHDPSDLYNLTKLTGEALCLGDSRPTVRVARLSNIYGLAMGIDAFLGQVLQEGIATGTVQFRQAPDSAKDYISLAQLVRLLPAIATAGRRRLYNVASGRNTSHAAIAAGLTRHFGWRCRFAPGAPTLAFPPIDTTRLTAEFGPALSDLSEDLPTLVPNPTEVPCSPSTRPVAA
ncbi:MAG TPA: NAD(P)-dependent oxidoreductase [Acetobacteraceae bacterium]|jgi:nucleoside-diphosphate-sugar epimerase